jgi:nucleoside phosphorylase
MLLIFGALKIELAGIIRKTGIREKCRSGKVLLYRGRIGKDDVLISITGMGKDNAARASGIVLKQVKAKDIKDARVLITGFCGACRKGLKAGDLVIYKSVMDLAGSGLIKGCENRKRPARYDLADNTAAGLSGKGMIPVTCGCTDHVASTPGEKKRLFDDHGAEVVDMESFWLIESLVNNGIPSGRIHCIRAVSDGAVDRLPSYMAGTGAKKTIADICCSAIKSVYLPAELKSNIYAFKNIRKAGYALARIPDILMDHTGFCS